MEPRKLTRRALIEGGTALGLVVIGTGSLAACGSGELDCSDTSALSAAEREQRRTLSYVDRSPNPSQRCEVCNFYTATEQANTCGRCSLNLGPVNPQGYCSSFAPRA